MKLKEFNFIGAKKISLSVSAALIAIILLCSLIFGVRLSVQFSGGTIVTYTSVSYTHLIYGLISEPPFMASPSCS